ncbi:MAG TPA: hypothetical protein G4N92_01955 [Anaerolineae bacterium]|nr:hypothetical protein [Anaerolineae bacterium]
MSRWIKIAFFALLLIASGFFLGTVCKQISQSYELIMQPSKELLNLLILFLLAVAATIITAGLVAILLKPVWVAMIAFALSGLAILVGWREVTLVSGVLALAAIILGLYFAYKVDQEQKERIKFSLDPISRSLGVLSIALVLLACGSIYIGCAAHIEQEGFSIPESFTEPFIEPMKEQITSQMQPQVRHEAEAELEEQFQGMLDDFSEKTLQPYEEYIPLAIAGMLFFSLYTVTNLFSFIPLAVLNLIFLLLSAVGMTKIVRETQEVEKLVME